jgi:hypothetical protein
VTARDPEKIQEFSGSRCLFLEIFEIEFVEMGKSAVPAAHNEVPAADSHVVRSGDMAVPAGSSLDQFPLIIAADSDIFSFPADILDTGHENPGGAAVVADDLGLVRYGSNNLVCQFFTMVAVRGVSC